MLKYLFKSWYNLIKEELYSESVTFNSHYSSVLTRRHKIKYYKGLWARLYFVPCGGYVDLLWYYEVGGRRTREFSILLQRNRVFSIFFLQVLFDMTFDQCHFSYGINYNRVLNYKTAKTISQMKVTNVRKFVVTVKKNCNT